MEYNELVELITKKVLERLLALEAMKVKEQPNEVKSNSLLFEKRVVTETDIQKIARQGIKELVIGRKTIVTPLAQDSIKINGMKVIKK